MKNIFPYIFMMCLALIFAPSKAQTTEPCILKVVYEFSHLYNKAEKQVYNTDMVLRVGKTNAKYNSLKKEYTKPVKRNPIDAAAMAASPKTVVAVGMPMTVVTPKEDISESIYQLPGEKKLVKIDRLGFQDYKMEMPLPVINWKIEKDTKDIAGIKCQKASGNFGGRHYTAWFAPSLAMKYGPWKLNGLPGLILEAADTAKEVVFTCKSVTRLENEDEYILYESGRKVSIQEADFNKAKTKFDKDPVAMSQAQLKSGTSVADIIYQDPSTGKALRGREALDAIKKNSAKVISNPLELKP